MSVIKIDIEKVSQEFEIAGKTYTAYWDDEALERYLNIVADYRVMAKKAKEINIEELSKEEIFDLKNQQLEALKVAIEKIFGEGTFETIYEDTGRSMMNLDKIAETVLGYIAQEWGKSRKQARAKYTKK